MEKTSSERMGLMMIETNRLLLKLKRKSGIKRIGTVWPIGRKYTPLSIKWKCTAGKRTETLPERFC